MNLSGLWEVPSSSCKNWRFATHPDAEKTRRRREVAEEFLLPNAIFKKVLPPFCRRRRRRYFFCKLHPFRLPSLSLPASTLSPLFPVNRLRRRLFIRKKSGRPPSSSPSPSSSLSFLLSFSLSIFRIYLWESSAVLDRKAEEKASEASLLYPVFFRWGGSKQRVPLPSTLHSPLLFVASFVVPVV